jgi:hypothetical protein
MDTENEFLVEIPKHKPHAFSASLEPKASILPLIPTAKSV